MKEIPLTQGQVALVDDEDFERVSAFKWYVKYSSPQKSFYAVRGDVQGRQPHLIYMARFIMNTPKGVICDHVHHNTLDNRKSELRNCTSSQNSANRIIISNGTKTGFKNIFPIRNKFRVQIQLNGKTVFRKNFCTLEEAIAARNEALKNFHGEFANIE